jgi:hypothetical protein
MAGYQQSPTDTCTGVNFFTRKSSDLVVNTVHPASPAIFPCFPIKTLAAHLLNLSLYAPYARLQGAAVQ